MWDGLTSLFAELVEAYAEMIELDEKIKSYRIVKGLEVSLVPEPSDEIKEVNNICLRTFTFLKLNLENM